MTTAFVYRNALKPLLRIVLGGGGSGGKMPVRYKTHSYLSKKGGHSLVS